MGFKTFISIIVLIVSSWSLSAQTLPDRAERRARNRVENRANSTVDRQVDRTVDGAVDAVGGLFRRRNRNRNQEQETTTETNTETSPEENAVQMPGFMTGGPWEPYTNPVPYSLTMEVTTIDRRGRTEENTVEFSVDTEAWGMRSTDRNAITRMILNTQTGKVTIVSTEDGETQAMRMRMPNMTTNEEFEETIEENMENITIERTGETRVIDGYTCEKVIYTNTEEEQVTEAWVTDDVELGVAEMFGPFAGMSQGRSPGSSAMAQDFMGFPIEMTSTDRRGEQVIMKMRNIKVEDDADHTILDVSGLQIQDMGF
ncbi:MAG: DUF4412 domain-containing protein [Bacteroidota bacterium]